jgi:8-hydroxy-5-deazaflavin:NADPH oxidoreductase
MNIAILGTGSVGQALAGKLISLGHTITIGTRNVIDSLSRMDKDSMGNAGIGQWVVDNPKAQLENFEDIIKSDTNLIINALSGQASLSVLNLIGELALGQNILIDISNPLDFSKGFPPTLTICNDDSLGELIQKTFPKLKVVKTLNTMSNPVMINPKILAGDHTVFVSGNDMEAKKVVSELLRDIGWEDKQILDLGSITTARGTEMILPLWVSVFGKLSTPYFNININQNKS